MTERERKRIILYAITSSQFAVPFMLSGVGVALPAIGAHFHSGAVALSLVESVFIATSAMLLLPFGRYADLKGHAPLFVKGLWTFCVTTLLLGLAPNMPVFILLRVAQGMGGAMTMATGLALLMNAYPREERGRALGVGTAGVYLGLSLGPYLGGLLTSSLGWRSVFFMGLLPLLLSLHFVRRLNRLPRTPVDEPFDHVGALLIIAGMGLLVGGSAGFSHTAGKLALGAGLLLLACFIRWESRHSAPLLNMSLIRHNRPFALGCLVQFINYAASFSVTFLMSLYLQWGRGISPYEAGSLLVIQPLVQAALSPLCGRLADKYPPHLIATAGMAVVTAALILTAGFDAHTSNLTFYLMLGIMGTGIALFASPNATVIMGSVESRDFGVASAMTGGMRTTGMTLSMVLVSLTLSHFLGDAAVNAQNFGQYLKVMHLLISGFAVLSGVGVLLSLAGSMERRPGRRNRENDVL